MLFIDLLKLTSWEDRVRNVMSKRPKFFKCHKINKYYVHKFIISRYEGNHQMKKTAYEVK